ncbi:hypothetical protein ACFLXU_06335 [Chloroflexota bacterium]
MFILNLFIIFLVISILFTLLMGRVMKVVSRLSGESIGESDSPQALLSAVTRDSENQESHLQIAKGEAPGLLHLPS